MSAFKLLAPYSRLLQEFLKFTLEARTLRSFLNLISAFGHTIPLEIITWSIPGNGSLQTSMHNTPKFLQINSPPGFFCNFFKCYGNSLGAPILFFNSQSANLFGERRVDIAQGTKQEWPDSGSTLKIFSVIFTKVIPRRIFSVLQKCSLCWWFCITYSFIVDNPKIVGNFLLLLGQDSEHGKELA